MKKTLKKSILLLSVLILIFCFACPVSAASINKRKVTLCTGQSVQLKVNGTKRKPKWYSNNKKVAIVNQSGKVTAKGKGSAVITAKIGKTAYKCSFRVESPKISKTSISLYKGKTYQLKMLNTKQKYKWSSKNRSIATVTSNGKITGKKTGTTYIYAKSASGKTFRCKVVIKSLPASKSPKMFLPNQKECGNADFFIEYNSQRSTGGKVVPIQVYKDFPMGYINYYAENLNQELNTYIYVDGVLWNNSRGACISGGSSLDGTFIKSGLHAVEMIQFANNNRYGSVVAYRRAMYKIIYK